MIIFLSIDPTANGSNSPSAKLSLGVRRIAISVIPGVGTTRYGHIDRKVPDIVR